MENLFKYRLTLLNLKMDLEAKEWDESKHPREDAGTSEGGQFTNKITTLNDGQIIRHTNYRNALKDRNKIIKILKEKNISYEAGNSGETGSYYLNFSTDKIEADIRLSNHTKPQSIFGNLDLFQKVDLIRVSKSGNTQYIEISVLNDKDFTDALIYINSIL